jgi:hypothetical protein
MVIHLYTVCWNEEKLSKHFVNYYSKFCDKIVVFDNNSTDNTVDKLLKNPKVEVRTFDTDGLRDDINRDIKNTCWKESIGVADYVIVCDFDEFLYHENLDEFLEKNKDFTVFHPDVFDMVTKEDFNDDINLLDFCKTGYLVEEIYNQKFNKCILFNPNKITEIGYSEGAHRLDNVKGDIKIYYNKGNFELKILHYKYLTLDYTLKRKDTVCKRLSEFNRVRQWGSHNCKSDEIWIDRFNKAVLNSKNVFELI